MARFFMRSFKYMVFLCLIGAGINFFLQKKSYVFTSRAVQTIAEKFVGQHPAQCLPKLITEFRKYHPHVLSPLPDWVLIGGDSLNYKLKLIHASTTESVFVIGSPIASVGHTGIHWLNTSCTVLTGTVERWRSDHSLNKEEFNPGQTVRFLNFETYVIKLNDDAWAVCYSRGFTPMSLPYFIFNKALADPLNTGRFLWIFIRSSFQEAIISFQELLHYYLGKRA